jgi:hypothetical protein
MVKLDPNHNIELLTWLLFREDIHHEVIGFGNICIKWSIDGELKPIMIFDYRYNLIKYCNHYTEIDNAGRTRLKKLFYEYGNKKSTWEG